MIILLKAGLFLLIWVPMFLKYAPTYGDKWGSGRYAHIVVPVSTLIVAFGVTGTILFVLNVLWILTL